MLHASAAPPLRALLSPAELLGDRCVRFLFNFAPLSRGKGSVLPGLRGTVSFPCEQASYAM
jgi:hypothetical protein